jgi:hypothetical protein
LDFSTSHFSRVAHLEADIAASFPNFKRQLFSFDKSRPRPEHSSHTIPSLWNQCLLKGCRSRANGSWKGYNPRIFEVSTMALQPLPSHFRTSKGESNRRTQWSKRKWISRAHSCLLPCLMWIDVFPVVTSSPRDPFSINVKEAETVVSTRRNDTTRRHHASSIAMTRKASCTL